MQEDLWPTPVKQNFCCHCSIPKLVCYYVNYSSQVLMAVNVPSLRAQLKDEVLFAAIAL